MAGESGKVIELCGFIIRENQDGIVSLESIISDDEQVCASPPCETSQDVASGNNDNVTQHVPPLENDICLEKGKEHISACHQTSNNHVITHHNDLVYEQSDNHIKGEHGKLGKNYIPKSGTAELSQNVKNEDIVTTFTVSNSEVSLNCTVTGANDIVNWEEIMKESLQNSRFKEECYRDGSKETANLPFTRITKGKANIDLDVANIKSDVAYFPISHHQEKTMKNEILEKEEFSTFVEENNKEGSHGRLTNGNDDDDENCIKLEGEIKNTEINCEQVQNNLFQSATDWAGSEASYIWGSLDPTDKSQISFQKCSSSETCYTASETCYTASETCATSSETCATSSETCATSSETCATSSETCATSSETCATSSETCATSSSCHTCVTCGSVFTKETNFREHVVYCHKVFNHQRSHQSQTNERHTENIRLIDERQDYDMEIIKESGPEKDSKEERVDAFMSDKCDIMILTDKSESLKNKGRRQNILKLEKERKDKRRRSKACSLQCSKCKIVFKSKAALNSHKKEHTMQGTKFCSLCSDTFITDYEHMKHLQNHKLKGKFKCGICMEYVFHSDMLAKHLEVHYRVRKTTKESIHFFRCFHCDKKYKVVQSLRSHVKLIHIWKGQNNSERTLTVGREIKNQEILKCIECGTTFPNKESWKDHTTRQENDIKRCPFCDVCCINACSYAKHVRRHGDISKRNKCNICGKTFTNVNEVEVHMRVHTGLKPFKCTICDKAFTIKSNRNKHMIRIHKLQNKSDKYTKKTRDQTSKKHFSCSLCQKQFHDISHLQRHMNIHDKVKPFSCHQCDKKFSEKHHLERHFLIHTGEKPFKCSECGKYFRHTQTLQQHKCVHTRNMPFNCEDCHKGFVSKQALVQHSTVHTGKKM